ncbi:MAG: Polyribonucleotide nucleotidyltransferase [Lentisphaerae bacterium ADurb.Bin242]|nr:MAG: Polyribonucleotide nucleotidyltransferase [Lentisphaerae bacterium ADurb.Bin242]
MPEAKVSIPIGPGKEIEISTGKLAKLANGSCLVRQGDTIILSAACSGEAKPGQDFFPLQVDYREKYSAAGRFPGGFIKREGRPSDKEILICRMADRPVRPLFPEGFFDEVQISGLLLSADGENEGDVLSILGASASLCLSDLPFQGPVGALRVGCVDGRFIANPTYAEMKQSTLELIYAGLPDKVIMIEGDCKELPEATLVAAMEFANEIVKKQVEAQLELMKAAGRPKKTPELHLVPEEIRSGILSICGEKLEAACLVPGKEDRLKALDELKAAAVEGLKEQFVPVLGEEGFTMVLNQGFDKLVEVTIRKAILEKGFRPDGRGVEDLRPLTAEVGVLPVVHGSGLFTRGETQALVVTTLGGPQDAQESDSIYNTDETRKFYLHYNFPNYSVGEVGRISGPGRREIGHGNLAERSLAQVIPADFPYTIRCLSEIMASNGSTSMASVCGGTLSLMDAGVPIKAPVVGISCGLVTDDSGKELILTDIIGAEDHYGDMDFKVCGTPAGITGFQLDLKLPGVSIDLLARALEQNKRARAKILDVIAACLPAPRAQLSPNAPQITKIMINPDKIGALIGTGGKNIKEITESTGAQVNIEDDGSVTILARNMAVLEEVKRRVEACTSEAEIGKIYRGLVKTVRDFGAFVEILPGQDGLLHISEMANYRVREVGDICKEGDYVTVKVIDIDRTGKIRLSRKAALEDLEKEESKKQ